MSSRAVVLRLLGKQVLPMHIVCSVLSACRTTSCTGLLHGLRSLSALRCV